MAGNPNCHPEWVPPQLIVIRSTAPPEEVVLGDADRTRLTLASDTPPARDETVLARQYRGNTCTSLKRSSTNNHGHPHNTNPDNTKNTNNAVGLIIILSKRLF